MITVDADEVIPNTEYTCNITGRVPPFTGVQLGELSVYNHSFFPAIFGRGRDSPPNTVYSKLLYCYYCMSHI